nr:MAG TPA: hypothetical protein [Caudoviricetes sp.]
MLGSIIHTEKYMRFSEVFIESLRLYEPKY